MDLYDAIVSSRTPREIEVRVRERGFRAGVSHAAFDRVTQHLTKHESFTKKRALSMKSYNGVARAGKGDVRFTVYKNGKSEAIRKVRLAVKDVPEYNLRVAQSTETKVPIESLDKFLAGYTVTLQRNKQRQSFTSTDWSVDLTVVSSDDPSQANSYEIEVEYVGKFPIANPKAVASAGESIIELLVQLVQDGHSIVANSFVNSMLAGYQSLLKQHRLRFVGPLPYTISKDQLERGAISCGYTVTDKADGTRYLCYINNDRHCCMIGRSLDRSFRYMGTLSGIPTNTLLDGELIGSTFYVFDCLAVGGRVVTQENLFQRLAGAEGALAKANAPDQLSFKMKKFYTKVFSDGYAIWNDRKNLFDYTLDGLVFTPIYAPYENTNIFKWKPYDTIDFQIRKLGNSTWELYIGGVDSNGSYTHFSFAGIDGQGTFAHRHKGKQAGSDRLLIPQSLGKTQVTAADEKRYPDYAIVEMKFDAKKQRWIPQKQRFDKAQANGIKAVNDAWVAITNPITPAVLKAGVYVFCGRRFHNAIKDSLVRNYMKGSAVLDIGSGAGGDIGKYTRHKVSQVVGVDIVDVEYPHNKEVMRFYKAPSDFYNVTNIIKNDKVKSFDVVSCQFAMHYFFKSMATLENFVANLDRTLKHGGLFVATCLNGTQVAQLFANGSKVYNSSAVNITKRFSGSSASIVGQEVSVMLRGTKYFKNESIEYLVHPNLFTSFMESRGYTLMQSAGFDSYCPSFPSECELMDQDMKTYSFLNMSMIFKRT